MKKSKYIALAAVAAFTVAPLSACGAGQSNGGQGLFAKLLGFGAPGRR